MAMPTPTSPWTVLNEELERLKPVLE
jgi:hypothetical protein